jgi:hypothetical protein
MKNDFKSIFVTAVKNYSPQFTTFISANICITLLFVAVLNVSYPVQVHTCISLYLLFHLNTMPHLFNGTQTTTMNAADKRKLQNLLVINDGIINLVDKVMSVCCLLKTPCQP